MSGLLEASQRPLRGGVIWLLRHRLRPIPSGEGLPIWCSTARVCPSSGQVRGRLRNTWPQPAWLADAPPWRRSVRRDPRPPRCQSGAPRGGVGGFVRRRGGIARRGPTVGLAVSGSRPPRGLPRAAFGTTTASCGPLGVGGRPPVPIPMPAPGATGGGVRGLTGLSVRTGVNVTVGASGSARRAAHRYRSAKAVTLLLCVQARRRSATSGVPRWRTRSLGPFRAGWRNCLRRRLAPRGASG